MILVFITAFTFVKLPAHPEPEPSLVGAERPDRLVDDGELVASPTNRPRSRAVAQHRASTASSTSGATTYPGTANAAAYARHGRAGRHDRDRWTSRPTTSPTRGGSRSSAASSTRSRATRTTPGSRFRATPSRRAESVVYTRPVRRAVRAQPREHDRPRHGVRMPRLQGLVRQRKAEQVSRPPEAAARRAAEGAASAAARADPARTDLAATTETAPATALHAPAARRSSPTSVARRRAGLDVVGHHDRPQEDRDHVPGHGAASSSSLGGVEALLIRTAARRSRTTRCSRPRSTTSCSRCTGRR